MEIGIIGTGPSGLAAATAAAKSAAISKLHIFDKNELPGGLLRYGVGPWNQEVKGIGARLIKELAHAPKDIRFYKNFEVTNDKLQQLSDQLDGIIMASGGDVEKARMFALAQCSSTINPDILVTCQDLVSYYNRYPSLSNHIKKRLTEMLRKPGDVVIIGMGNVALDVATYLAQRGGKHQIFIVGRKSINHASWQVPVLRETNKHLRLAYIGSETIQNPKVKSLFKPGVMLKDAEGIVVDRSMISTGEDGSVRIKRQDNTQIVLPSVKMVIPCLGFAQPYTHENVSKETPLVHVGWNATFCKGDAGSAIISGKQGLTKLLTFKPPIKHSERRLPEDFCSWDTVMDLCIRRTVSERIGNSLGAP